MASLSESVLPSRTISYFVLFSKSVKAKFSVLIRMVVLINSSGFFLERLSSGGWNS